jgi:Domain of unknown function (DUF4082)/Bacterial Ig-like domain (group 2)
MRATGRLLLAILVLALISSAAIAQTKTLFSSTATPASPNSSAGSPVEVGMKFTSDTAGYITAIRFYKGASNTGTHVGTLWTSAGAMLAQVNFNAETASGWQQGNLATPVPITPYPIYVVSYHSSGAFSYDPGFFNVPVNNAPLHAVQNSGISNGVYAYGPAGTFPTTGGAGANFWVDVVFSTTLPALVSLQVTPANPTIAVGSTQQFRATGTYADSSTRDISGDVTWTSGPWRQPPSA